MQIDVVRDGGAHAVRGLAALRFVGDNLRVKGESVGSRVVDAIEYVARARKAFEGLGAGKLDVDDPSGRRRDRAAVFVAREDGPVDELGRVDPAVPRASSTPATV